MKTIPLGKSGVDVSALCLGAMMFGSTVDEATSFKLLDHYTRAGGSFIDTSNNYAHWVEGCTGSESETLLGKWFKLRGNRSRIFLATKVGFDRKGVGQGLRAWQIEHWFNNSLKLMNTDYIDLYYAHTDDRDTPVEETMEAFGKLAKAGKVRFLGASNWRAWRLEEARAVCRQMNLPGFCCVQQRHTYLHAWPGIDTNPQVIANEDLMDFCQSTGMTVLAYGALLHGAYDRPERLDPQCYIGGRRLTVLQEMAKEKGIACSQLVIAWLVNRNPHVIPLMGVSNTQQIDENIKALEIKLSPRDIQCLDKA